MLICLSLTPNPGDKNVLCLSFYVSLSLFSSYSLRKFFFTFPDTVQCSVPLFLIQVSSFSLCLILNTFSLFCCYLNLSVTSLGWLWGVNPADPLWGSLLVDKATKGHWRGEQGLWWCTVRQRGGATRSSSLDNNDEKAGSKGAWGLRKDRLRERWDDCCFHCF